MTATIESLVVTLQRPKPADVRPPGFLADTWNVMVRELRPVSSRNTSSSVALATSRRRTGAPATSRSVTNFATRFAAPAALARTVVPVRATEALSPSAHEAPSAASTAAASSAKPSVTRSPSPDLSATAVSSAITSPWSMTTTRSAIASASSR